jgi:hypothetical protein
MEENKFGARLARPWCLALASFAACSLGLVSDGQGSARTGVAAERATLVQEDDPAVTWSGAWATKRLAVSSGGTARLTMDAGTRASISFVGTGVRWIGYRDEWCGLARVYVDGELLTTVDTHSGSARARATLYSVSELAPGPHTLAIEATGTHSAASAGSWVWVDAFWLSPGRVELSTLPGGTALPSVVPLTEREAPAKPTPARAAREVAARLEQDDDAVSWSGAWSTNELGAHHGGSARLSMESGARVSVVFSGTGVTWIGYQDEWSGIADVSADGEARTTVDTYSATAKAQAELYSIQGLPAGTHTLLIEATGRRRAASAGSWVWVDAFSVTR